MDENTVQEPEVVEVEQEVVEGAEVAEPVEVEGSVVVELVAPVDPEVEPLSDTAEE